MKQRIYKLLVCLMFTTTPLHANEPLEAQAKERTKALANALQSALKSSLKEDGPVAAVQVCHTRAPEIVSDVSNNGWLVGRTALKVRNPNNAADEWEKATLEDFAKQLAAGVNPSELYTSKTDDKEFRFMKAIPTGGVCLTCHGESVSGALADKIAQLYPNDQATGFKLGELRGAFTLRKKLSL